MTKQSKTSNYLAHAGWLCLILGVFCSKALQSFSIIFLLLSVLTTLFQGKINFSKKPFRQPLFWLTLLFFWVVITGFWSNTFGGDALKLKSLGVLFLFSYFNTDYLKTYGNHLVKGFIACACLFALLTLGINLLSNDQLVSLTQDSGIFQPFDASIQRTKFGAFAPFSDRLHFSYLLVIGMLLALLRWPVAWQKMLKYGAALLLFFTCIFLGARGSQIGLIALMGYFIFQTLLQKAKERGISHPKVKLIVSGLLFSLVMFFAAYKIAPQLSNRWAQTRWELNEYRSGRASDEQLKNFTSVHRLVSAESNVNMIKSSPLIGIGVNDYAPVMQKYLDAKHIPIPPHRHNTYLYFWAISGIIGFALFCLALFYWINNKNALLTYTGIFFAVILIFDAVIWYKTGQLMIGFVLCLYPLENFREKKKV